MASRNRLITTMVAALLVCLAISSLAAMITILALLQPYLKDNQFGEAVRFMLPRFWLVAGAVTLLLTLLGTIWLIFRTQSLLFRPLARLKQGAIRIRDGDLSWAMPLPENSSDDDMQDVAQSFEDMRIRLKDSMILAQRKEEERLSLMANVTHDMRTPITSILGYAEGILDNVASTPEQIRAYAHIIQSKALVLKTLADDMALLSLLESKPPLVLTQVDLAALCEHLAKEVELDGFFLVKTDIHGPLHVMVEKDKMERVFQNLISNAAKYGKPVDSKPMLEFTARRNGDSALITLSDNGPGLSVEEQRRVFSRFYRVDSSRGEKNGSGLGLAICQQIIELLGGKIWMSQREQGGLSCHMLIPLREDKS